MSDIKQILKQEFERQNKEIEKHTKNYEQNKSNTQKQKLIKHHAAKKELILLADKMGIELEDWKLKEQKRTYGNFSGFFYKKQDIEEFIKKLKKEINNNCITDCSVAVTKNNIFEIIDKLYGEKI